MNAVNNNVSMISPSVEIIDEWEKTWEEFKSMIGQLRVSEYGVMSVSSSGVTQSPYKVWYVNTGNVTALMDEINWPCMSMDIWVLSTDLPYNWINYIMPDMFDENRYILKVDSDGHSKGDVAESVDDVLKNT